MHSIAKLLRRPFGLYPGSKTDVSFEGAGTHAVGLPGLAP